MDFKVFLTNIIKLTNYTFKYVQLIQMSENEDLGLINQMIFILRFALLSINKIEINYTIKV